MFINTHHVICTIAGEPFKVKAGDPASDDLTMGLALVEALLAEHADEKLEATQKIERFELAERFHKAPLPVKVTRTEVDQIKKLVARRWSITVTARIIKEIEQPTAAVTANATAGAGGATTPKAA